MELIPLSEVLKQMERTDAKGKPVPFDIAVCTYDRFRKKGGERLELKQVVVYRQKHVKKTPSDKTKIPNHYENGTRNLLILSSGQIRKIHIRLIEKFNGKIVYY